ncbi:putative exported protein [Moritella viscosa]|nr:putative exported protein [Moritella viscosa]
MRLLFIILSLVLSLNCMASASVPSKYKDIASQVNRIDLIMFDKAELMELGTCVGVELAKHNKLENLSEACDEVVEDRINPLGMLSLSKKEAVQMGQELLIH